MGAMAETVVRTLERVGAGTIIRRGSLQRSVLLSGGGRKTLLFGALTLAAYLTEFPGSEFKASEVPACYDTTNEIAGANHIACYNAMAVNPRLATAAPFAFRVLIPFTVHLLPVAAWIGFHIVTAVAIAAAGVLLFDLVEREFGTVQGMLAVALLWTSGAVSLSLRAPGRIDAALLFFGVATMYLARRVGWWWAAAAVAVGISAHELTAMYLVPLVVAAWPAMRQRSLLLVLPAAVVFVVLHFTPLLYGYVIAPYPALSAGNREMIRSLEEARAGGLLQAGLQAAVVALGLAWVLAAMGWRRCPPFYRAMATVLIPAVAAFAIAADWDRLLSMGALLLIPMACCALQRSHPRPPAVTT
jgi:hypothetical protein